MTTFTYRVTVWVGENDHPSASATGDIREAIEGRLDDLESSIKARARVYCARTSVDPVVDK